MASSSKRNASLLCFGTSSVGRRQRRGKQTWAFQKLHKQTKISFQCGWRWPEIWEAEDRGRIIASTSLNVSPKRSTNQGLHLSSTFYHSDIKTERCSHCEGGIPWELQKNLFAWESALPEGHWVGLAGWENTLFRPQKWGTGLGTSQQIRPQEGSSILG